MWRSWLGQKEWIDVLRALIYPVSAPTYGNSTMLSLGAPFGDREDEGRVRRSLERGRYAPLHAGDKGVV